MIKEKKTTYQSPRGMHDTLPQDEGYIREILGKIGELADSYNFELLHPPLLEAKEVFEKGTGETSEVVEKQMYFVKGSENLVLRPEKTAGIARAYIENGLFNLPQPQKFYSVGPVFRHEKPQEGRFRQFYQVDFDIFAEEHPVADFEIIRIFFKFLHNLELKDVIVEVNSIGCKECRNGVKESLRQYWRKKLDHVCADCKIRFQRNVFRMLECKNENCRSLSSQAPPTLDRICERCSTHLKSVLEYLDTLNLPYELNPHLVRGLDYYSRTVFEFFPENDKTLALAGGGRYDYLAAMLGGKDTPAVGGASGIERIVEAMKKKKNVSPKGSPDIFLVQIGADARKEALKLREDFIAEKIAVAESLGKDSLHAQLRGADASKVAISVIVGQEEILRGEVILRDMKSGVQETIPREKAASEIKRRLKK